MINYSFIIPHKNSPTLLQKCIDSIPRMEDVQIIVVDDNSDESKVDFEHFPGMSDETIEVYLTKEGRGAGYARNCGLEHAVGKWVIFADSDDFFTKEIESAMDAFADSDKEVIFFKSESIKIPSGERSWRSEELNSRVDTAISVGDFSLAMLYSSPWQKFFNRDFLVRNSIKFNEVRWGNDVVFMGQVAKYATKIDACDKVIYCITESDNSIIKDPSVESRIVRFHQESENVNILKRTKYKHEPSIYYWHFRTWFDVWKLDKLKAWALLPKAFCTSGFKFVKEAFKAKFS